MSARTCGHCGASGHYRPTCPTLPTAERAAKRAARAPRMIPAAKVSPCASAAPPERRSPWSLVESERPTGPTIPFVARFVWEHAETGERVTATVPLPPSGDRYDAPGPVIVLRHPLDPEAHAARHLPTATVMRSPRELREAAPVNTTACGWGLW